MTDYVQQAETDEERLEICQRIFEFLEREREAPRWAHLDHYFPIDWWMSRLTGEYRQYSRDLAACLELLDEEQIAWKMDRHGITIQDSTGTYASSVVSGSNRPLAIVEALAHREACVIDRRRWRAAGRARRSAA